jgi:hypothetical protein
LLSLAEAHRAGSGAIGAKVARRTDGGTVGVRLALGKRREFTEARAISAAGIRVAIIARIIHAHITRWACLADQTTAPPLLFFADANAAAVRSSPLRVAIVFRVVDAGESRSARESGDTAAERRLRTRRERRVTSALAA